MIFLFSNRFSSQAHHSLKMVDQQSGGTLIFKISQRNFACKVFPRFLTGALVITLFSFTTNQTPSFTFTNMLNTPKALGLQAKLFRILPIAFALSSSAFASRQCIKNGRKSLRIQTSWAKDILGRNSSRNSYIQSFLVQTEIFEKKAKILYKDTWASEVNIEKIVLE